ncbi:MAG: type IV pilus twitching motility protein PilT [Vampirovibrionales bacterium]|nr:type IV pilus twitching motility protein PilT [Vampirovibrionales bacterium]
MNTPNPFETEVPVQLPPQNASEADAYMSEALRAGASGQRIELGELDLDTLLRLGVAQGSSDIHLRVGVPPMLRKDGDIFYTKLPPISLDSMKAYLQRMVPKSHIPKLQQRTDHDFSFSMPGLARFRVNLFYEMNRPGMVLRVVPERVPKLEDLNLPDVLGRFNSLNRGLVLFTGPTGAGKTTTMAALLEQINRIQAKHIITLEDPVEFVHTSQKSIITQRQLGLDTDTFPNGIKYALRQDPDVVLIGEMRDRETMMAALHAAETGHLVFSTLHTNDAVQTINRIINAFEPHEREPVRFQLANVLQGTVSQRLVRKAEGAGRLAMLEIMFVTPAVRDYIERNEIDEIYALLKAGEFEGMCSLNLTLYKAYQNGLITDEIALGTSDNPHELHQMLRGAFHGSV